MAERPSLPEVDITDIKGLFTKPNPESLGPNQLRSFENGELFSTYSGVRRVRGNKPLLNEVYQESGVTLPIAWVRMYKFPDLNGQLHRDVLFAGGTTIQKLNSDGSTTQLASGLQSGLDRTTSQLDQNMFIAGQNPFLIGDHDRMMKYTGSQILNWGIVPPGSNETVIETFADPLSFTVTAGNIYAESVVTWDGDSIQLQDLTGGPYSVQVNKATYNFDLPNDGAGNADIPNRMAIHIFVDPLYYDSLASTTSFYILVNSNVAPLTNYYEFDLKVGDLIPGWNVFPMDFTTAKKSVAPPTPTGIKRLDIFVSSTVPIQGIYFDRWVLYDRGTPSLSLIQSVQTAYAYDDVPGFQIDSFNAVGNWTASGGGSLSQDLVTYREGTASMALTTGNNNTTTITNNNAGAGLNLAAWNTMSQITFWLYMPSIGSDIVPTSISLKLINGTAGGGTDYLTFTLQNYWNSNWSTIQWVSLAFSSNIPHIGVATGGTWNPAGAINRIEITLNFGSSAVRPGLRFDNLYAFQHGFTSNGGNILTQDNSVVNPSPPTSTHSVKATKLDPNTTQLVVYKKGITPFNISAQGSFQIWMYIPTPANLAASAITVQIGDSGLVNTNTWIVPQGTVASGWKEYSFDLSQSSSYNQTGTGAPLGAVTDISVTFNFTAVGRLEDGYRVDSCHFNQLSGSGPLVGNYTYRVTFVTKSGVESNAGPVSDTIVAPTGGVSVQLNNIPVSPDPQVVTRIIYRTVAGGSGVWLYDQSIPDNSTTSIADSIADQGLGTQTPPETGSQTSDNGPPPSAGITYVWKRTCFLAGDPLNPHVLYFSNDDGPEEWPTLNAFELDSRIVGIYETYLGLFIVTDQDHWRILGDNPNYILEKVVQGIGAVSPHSVGTGKLEGWSTDRDGLRLYDLRQMNRISEPIADKYPLLENPINRHTVYSKRHNALVQFDKYDGTNKFDTPFLWTHIQDQMPSGGWSTLNFNHPGHLAGGFNPICSAVIEDTDLKTHIYCGSDDGMLYELFEDNTSTWLDADGTPFAIRLKMQTPWLRLGPLGQQLFSSKSRVWPRFFELRAVEATNQAMNWTVIIETSMSSSDNNTNILDSQTLNILMEPGVGLVLMPCQPMIAGLYMRITIETSDPDTDPTYLGSKLYIVTQPGQGSINESP